MVDKHKGGRIAFAFSEEVFHLIAGNDQILDSAFLVTVGAIFIHILLPFFFFRSQSWGYFFVQRFPGVIFFLLNKLQSKRQPLL